MFGKKNKSAEGEAPAMVVEPKKGKVKEPKVAKPAKAKKKKAAPVVGNSGPNFFAAHVEKMVFAVAVSAVGYFIYAGIVAEGYPSSNKPEDLQRKATTLLTQVRDEDHWEQIAAERQVTHEFAKLANEARRPTDPSFYIDADVVWDPKPARVFERRGDPALFPAEKLLARNVYGAMAVEVDKDEADPFDLLKDPEPLKKKEPESNNRRGGRGGRGGGFGGGEGMMGEGGEGGEGGFGNYPGGGAGEAKTPVRRLTASYDLGVRFGAGAGGGTGRGGMMGGGMMGSEGEMGGEMGGGMGRGGMMGGGGTMGGVGGGAGGLGENRNKGPKTKVAARGVIFNAITAVVPHRKMAEEYDKVFENTGPLDPMRDMPIYRSFEVQRVDVTDDPTRKIEEREWKLVSNGIEQLKMINAQKWAVKPPLGRPVPEIIDPNAYDRGLTMPIPPMLLRDYRDFSKHPLVAWQWDSKPLMPARSADDTKKQADEDTDMLPGDRPQGGQGGMMGGMGGRGGMMGGGMMGGGYGSEMGGEEGGEGMMGGGYGEGMMGGGYGSEMGGDEMMGGGMMGGGMMGGYGGGMGGGYGASPGVKIPQPEHKMLRCYDMLQVGPKEIGKVYRYRVRLMMRDPNYPDDARIQAPAPNELKDEVWARVSAIQRKDDAAIKADPKVLRTMRYTEWSEPSPPVMVKAPYEVFAGAVDFDGPRSYAVGQQTISVATSEPEGKLVIAGMDTGKTPGAMYALEEEVRRGSVLSRKANIEVISPLTKQIKLAADYVLNSQAIVADIRGGAELAGSSKDDPLVAPGEYMIMHRDNRVQVTNELDDMFLYRMYMLTDEKEAAEKANQGPGGGGGMFGEGDMGGMGGKEG